MPYAKKSSAKSGSKSSYSKSNSYNKTSHSKKVVTVTAPIMKVDPVAIKQRLTEEQLFVCDWLCKDNDQPLRLLVQAVPGSGKSSTAAHGLYGYIKKEKEENNGKLVNKILMTSFSRRSVTDLITKARNYGLIVDEKGKLVHKDVVIQGIHAFMYSRLRTWWSNRGCIVDYRDEWAKASEKAVQDNKYNYLIFLGKNANNHGVRVESIAKEYSTSEYFVRDEIVRWINLMLLWTVDPNYPQYNEVTPRYIADKYNITYKNNDNMFEDILSVAQAVMKEGFEIATRRKHPQITYAEMMSVPYKLWQLGDETMSGIVEDDRYDVVIGDECQDFNPLQLHILMRTIVNPKNNSKVLFLGEDKQAIYGFQGSPNDMLSKFVLQDYNFDEHRLTYSFRCSKKVVEYVSKIFSGIQAFHTNEEGELLEYYESEGLEKLQKDYLDSIDNPVTVLSRTNAPLIVFALECITRKIPVAFSKETGITGMLWGYYSTLKTFCSEYFKIDLDQNFEQLPELIDRYYETSVELFKDGYSGKKDVETASEEYLESLKEDMEALRKCFFAFHGPEFSHVTSMNKLVEEIKPLLEATNPKVLLSTIHTAKGLEWPEVWLLQNLSGGYQVNNPRMTEDDKKQENHVYYVGCSRSQNILVHLLKDNQPRGLYLLDGSMNNDEDEEMFD